MVIGFAVTLLGCLLLFYLNEKDMALHYYLKQGEQPEAFRHWLERQGSGIPAEIRTILETADSFELLILEKWRTPEEAKGTFRGKPVSGRMQIQDPVMRRKVLTWLYMGVARAQGIGCFCGHDQLYGISARKGDDEVELVLTERGQLEIASADQVRKVRIHADFIPPVKHLVAELKRL